MPVLDELIVALGYDYDSDGIENFRSDLTSVTGDIKKFITTAIVGATAFSVFVERTTHATDQQGKFATQIGESTEDVSALQFALIDAGGEASAMDSTLETLATRIGETARGVGSGVEAFGILGISVQDTQGKLKKGSDVLLEITDSLQGLSKSRQLDLAAQLGVSGSLRLIQKGRAEIERLTDSAKALGDTTEQDAKAAAELQSTMNQLFQIIGQVSRMISKVFSPILKDVGNDLTDWWLANRELIEQNIPKFIEKGAQALKLLTVAAAAFVSIRLGIILLRILALMRSLSVVTALTAGAVLILPALISAGIIAIGLLADDAKGFFNGADSAIGDLIDRFPEWENQIIVVASAAATLADVTGMIFEGWAKVIALFKSENLEQTINDFKFALTILPDIIRDMLSALGDFTGFSQIEKLADFFIGIADTIGLMITGYKELIGLFKIGFTSNDVGEVISNLPGFLFDGVSGAISSPPSQINPIAGQGSVLANNTTNTRNNSTATKIDKIDINIIGSTNPTQVASEAVRLFQQTQQDLSSVVDQ